MSVIHWLRPNANGGAACGAGGLIDLDFDPEFVTCSACLELAKGTRVIPLLDVVHTWDAEFEPGQEGTFTYQVQRKMRVRSLAWTCDAKATFAQLTTLEAYVGVNVFVPGVGAWPGTHVMTKVRNDTAERIVATLRILAAPWSGVEP